MRVLISAYACEPDKGSEPYVGWTWVHAIAQVVDEVHVITRANNREPIQQALSERTVGNLYFHYFDLPEWIRFWKKGQKGVQLYYYLWQYALKHIVWRLHERYQFDVIHHLTMAGMQYPPGIASLATVVPFIWGPIGRVQVPPSLRQHLHWRAKISEYTHDLLLWVACQDPLVKRAFQKAKIILIFPRAAPLQIPRGKLMRTGNIFIDIDNLPVANFSNQGHYLYLVSALRMIFLKGVDLGLEALFHLKKRGVPVYWTLIGDGPEKPRWEAMARRLGVADMIEFRGQVPRAEVLRFMRQGDVLLHPAFREGWGGAVLEGMSMGLPVVCLDWGGPGYIVDDESGIKVSVDQPRERIVEGLADAIERLQDPALRRRMGEAARERVRKYFSLETLTSIVEQIYDQVRL